MQSFKRMGWLKTWGGGGLSWSHLLILMSLSGPFSFASRGFASASPLISKCSALWNSEKVTEGGVLLTGNGRQKGLHAQESLWALLGISLMKGPGLLTVTPGKSENTIIWACSLLVKQVIPEATPECRTGLHWTPGREDYEFPTGFCLMVSRLWTLYI